MIEVTLGGGAGGFNWLPVLVAQRQGMFARQGLNVEINRLGTVDKATAAVKSGDVPLAITPPDGAIRDCAAGGGLRIVAGNTNALPLSLVANKRFGKIEDLKGAVLGTSSLTEGTALYTMAMLEKHGLSYPGDYEFSVVGVHPARWAALQDGSIDAALQPPPLNFIAFDAGYANLGEISDYIPEIAFTSIITQDAWAQDNGDTIVALLSALIEATQWLYDTANDAVLTELTGELTQSDAHYAKLALDYMRAISLFPRDLAIPASALEKSFELMSQAGQGGEATKATLARAVDDRYRARAAGGGR